MKRTIPLVLAMVLLAACGAPAAPTVNAPTPDPSAEQPQATPTAGQESDMQLVRADVPRVNAPDVSQAQVGELVRGQHDFAFDLYRTAAGGSDENLIFSPYSIALAFSMVYAGARGSTEAQMQQVLNFLPQDLQHPTTNALDQHLASLGEQTSTDEEGREPFTLHIANAVWGQQGFSFRDAFLETLAQHYDAGLRITDFTSQPDRVAEEINRWIEEQTEERIKNMVPPGMLTPDTRLALVNAIYFKAAWGFILEESQTKDGPFTLLDGTQVTVPLMHGFLQAPYSEGDGYQALRLHYKGDQADMLVILPELDRFAEIEQRLNAEFFDQLLNDAEDYGVRLSMPRWQFDSKLDLKELLTTMGLTEPFGQGETDFSGIDENNSLFISNAIHRGTITVDEYGTEAAAATLLTLDAAAGGPSIVEMTLDRPFIFAIVERETGAILFLGRVMNPA